ncbi:bifunctional UDP-N-acetylmuramoyl-tripeptide:D-alanyl-D-alanine ligase/alanine racemase [Fulvivirga sp. 29W222]|uniref:Alanine racemase n=1 Tax=Fulvivirga marina TaxID=2494733 RepID=A0A937FUB0_9BACT|nr:bifunctional UDP-N-acetylmuramoyl-tripeptide:D-alanyl-D-alanine ligase/alanine racemase [Fulvivirga marina]MBL6446215.1 bifunctional UDP-N-acetylmuramoyl-tripeptide:D-alanyl-D-alanine ligase/alanine racemase [Fulvivirga marina]
MINFNNLAKIASGEIVLSEYSGDIKYLITDSRKSFFAGGGIFFAISGERHDGHEYIKSLYDKGVRQFVVERDIDISGLEGSNLLKVRSSLAALQALARKHREQFNIEVIGITGSNGKTIVKEWLFQLIVPHKRAVKNPHSYNSQIGVPLSVWQLNEQHEVGIFEAGISEPGEMEKLEVIIQPTIGIFTNIGSAHDAGFNSYKQKIQEKVRLFKNAVEVIYCKDHEEVDQHLANKGFSWGHHVDSDVRIIDVMHDERETVVNIRFGSDFSFRIPFVDKASLENCLHCIAYMLFKGYDFIAIQEGISKLHKVHMRLELKKAIHGSYVIDDVYNNDLAGLQIALDFLSHQKQHERKSVIISDILQSVSDQEKLYAQVSELLKAANVTKLVGIGSALMHYKVLFDIEAEFYETTSDFLQNHDLTTFREETILIKGARTFTFEKIVRALEEKIHGTQLEINLDALTNNLNFFRSRMKPETKLMVMVKAFAYGSGSLEVANLLQFHRVDYLGVAYADEGMILRKNGIYLPIMVMNPSEDSFEKLYQYQLEPEVYNFNIIKQLIAFLGNRTMRVHIKLDTGMRRLGFEEGDIDSLVDLLEKHRNIEVKSIFSHLAGADEAEHNQFSQEQAAKFKSLSDRVMKHLHRTPLRHLVNSPGIVRFPEFHFDMVRLGIGLYGLEASKQEQHRLQPISRLKTIISQIKQIKKGETIGYSRKGLAKSDMQIATIAIGYADGFSRAFSNGVGEVWLNGKNAPVIGNVCMDMTMIDITGIDAVEGDEVEVFGEHLTIIDAASRINTIPYEILTNVSQRVKRIYYME